MAKYMDYGEAIFKNEITIKGKHAEYLKFLSPNKSQDDETKQSKKYYLFDNYAKTFIVCTIIGLKSNRKVLEEDTTSMESAKIKDGALFRHRENLEYMYHMVVLVDNRHKSPKECVELAFSTDVAQIQKNIETVYAYFRGGIEQVYDEFKDMELKNEDEYIDMVWKYVENEHILLNPPQPTI
jgi:hypothetical protein